MAATIAVSVIVTRIARKAIKAEVGKTKTDK
jgi:hypothetical protein